MSETQDRRHARLDALSDHQRAVMLAYLCGIAPEDVDAALDIAERPRAAARVTDGAQS